MSHVYAIAGESENACPLVAGPSPLALSNEHKGLTDPGDLTDLPVIFRLIPSSTLSPPCGDTRPFTLLALKGTA